MAYLVVLVVYHFVLGDTKEDRGPIRVGHWAGAVPTLSSLPVIVFAFTCHQNVCSHYHKKPDISNDSYRCSLSPTKSATTAISAQQPLSSLVSAAQLEPTSS